MEVILKLELHGEQFERLLHALHLLTEGINTMSSVGTTGVQALTDLTTAVSTFVASEQAAAALEAEVLAALAAEIALVNSQSSAADPVKLEALVGQLQAANAARLASNATMSAALTPVVPPPPPALTPTTTTVAVDSTDTVFSGGVVGDGTVVPTGSVTLTDPTGAISGSAALDSTGGFSITLSAAPVAGDYSVTASYGGDAVNAASTGSVGFTVAVVDAPPADGGDTAGGSTL